MARTYAKILLTVWDSDSDFQQLTMEAQWLYWVLISQPALSSAGVLPLQPRKWAGRASNATHETVAKALAELIEGRYVVIDEGTEEALVRTFIRHDGGWNNPNMRKGIEASIGRIESRMLAATACGVLTTADGKDQVTGSGQDPPEGSDEGSTEGDWQSTFHLPPSTNSANSAGATPDAPPTVDPLYDALVTACGWNYDEMTQRQRRSTGVARAELAKVKATPETIHARAEIFTTKYPNATLTPHAIASHWASLKPSRRRAETIEVNGVTIDRRAFG